jgi:hypothetical protein
LSIRIEEKQKPAMTGIGSLIAGASETKVRFIGEQSDARTAIVHNLDGFIRAMIVNDDDFYVDSLLPPQRFNTGCNTRGGVVRHHHSSDVRRGMADCLGRRSGR